MIPIVVSSLDDTATPASRAAAHALDNPNGVARLLDGLRKAGAAGQAAALACRLPGARGV